MMKAKANQKRRNFVKKTAKRRMPTQDAGVVQMREAWSRMPGELDWEQWAGAMTKAGEETLLHQREAIAWWERSASCWLAPTCAAHKLLGFGRSVMMTMASSAEALVDLTADQQRQWAAFWKRWEETRPHTVAGAPEFAEGMLFTGSTAARNWGLILGRSQAQIAGALADFWSLPSSD